FHAAGRSTGYQMGAAVLRSWSRNISHQVVVSKDALALVETVAAGGYEMLFNGVEVPMYRDAVAHPTEGPTIFFCGRHEERKGLEVLLQAMGSLGPEVRLWIGSTGPDSDRLRSEHGADPRIEWLGRLSDADKCSRLKGADVFCAPSLHGESFGVVLIEAMAAGTAIVASGLDGYRNVATNEVDALLVEPGDVGALVVALQRLFTDGALRARLQAAGECRAETFSMDKLARRYAEIYTSLVATGERRSEWQLRTALWRARLANRMPRMMQG
ncbi:MAG: glycosyltransferase family 4 protein, partial [Ilumatobacteraceae bacterium]